MEVIYDKGGILLLTFIIAFYLLGSAQSLSEEEEKQRTEDYAKRYQYLLFILLMSMFSIMGGDFNLTSLMISAFVIAYNIYSLGKN